MLRISQEIGEEYEKLAANELTAGNLPAARAMLHLANRINDDTKFEYAMLDKIKEIVEAEVERKIKDPVPDGDWQSAPDWWTALDRVEHLALALRFEEATALFDTLKKQLPKPKQVLPIWIEDWRAISEYVYRRLDDDERVDAKNARVKWFEDRTR